MWYILLRYFHFNISDSGFFSQDPSYLITLNNHPNSSLEIGACNNDVSNRIHIAENVSNNLNRSVRGVQGSYGQRSTSTFRASSTNFCTGYIAASDEGQQMVAKSYPSRHPRPSPNLRLRNVDRIGRNHVSSERYRASTEEASFCARLTTEFFFEVIWFIFHVMLWGIGNKSWLRRCLHI